MKESLSIRTVSLLPVTVFSGTIKCGSLTRSGDACNEGATMEPSLIIVSLSLFGVAVRMGCANRSMHNTKGSNWGVNMLDYFHCFVFSSYSSLGVLLFLALIQLDYFLRCESLD